MLNYPFRCKVEALIIDEAIGPLITQRLETFRLEAKQLATSIRHSWTTVTSFANSPAFNFAAVV